MFPRFVSNELDPLLVFDDSAFHANCFYSHPLADKAMARSEEIQELLGPGNRICVVCDQEITDPDDYFSLYHLTDDMTHPLYQYNYLQFHRSHLADWDELLHVRMLLKKFNSSGKWKGRGLAWLIEQIDEVLPQ